MRERERHSVACAFVRGNDVQTARRGGNDIMARGDASFSLKVRSSEHIVGDVVAECREFLMARGVKEPYGVTVVLRELVMNAIQHGNKSVVVREVAASIEPVSANQFKITVEDEGDGFKYEELQTCVTDDGKGKQARGYTLISTLADRLEFNDKGNCITAYVSAT